MGAGNSHEVENGKQGGSDAARLQPRTGATRDGVPLSFNRPPAADLEPWLGRVMVAVAQAPDDYVVNGLLCNDASYIRTAIGVDWTVGTADGELRIRDETFVCGQHSKAMPLEYVGGIKVAGMMFRPGAFRAIWGKDDGPLIDRIKPTEFIGIPDAELTGLYDDSKDPLDWLIAMEDWLRHYIARHGIRPPEKVSQKFEAAAFADPNQSINDFAEDNGVTPRTLQRIIKRDFGMTPKQVMRRARTLDLAARLCGVADEEEEEIYLRFFDQSHQIREFTTFFSMTPKQFVSERQGLLTLSLEIRQARRLEVLHRLEPDSIRPWMREPFAPAVSQTAS